MTRMKWMPAILVALGLVTDVGAGATSPGVVVQKGIHGLRLGMTQAQVKANAGTPRHVERGANEIGSYVTYRYRTYSVTFFGGSRVTQLETRSPLERTAHGIGVGSTKRRVTERVPGVRCMTELGYAHCYVGVWKPGRTVTDFVITNGRVARISIGYVID